MVKKKILKFLGNSLFVLPEFWLCIIVLPAVPALLYVENEKIRNFLYMICVPIGVFVSVAFLIILKKRRIFFEPESRVGPILENLDQLTSIDLVIDKNKLNP